LIRSRIIRVAAVASLVGAGLAGLAATSSGADITLVSCNTATSTAKLNPTLGSGDAKYIKASSALAVGNATNGSCTVDSGIRHDQSTQSVKYTLDDQSNGNTNLTVTSQKGSLSGSVSCNATDTSLITDYPASYPLQGTIKFTFSQLDAKGKALAMALYVRGGRDNADPDPTHFGLTGIVTKGVGVGGDVHATLSFFPDLSSTKNLNFLDCVATTAARNASLAQLIIFAGDGSDAGTAVDPLTVTIPSS
jgi:hypothetical protein